MIMSWTKCLFLIRVWGTIQSLFPLHLRVNLTSIYAFSHTAKSFPVFISIDNIIHESSMYLYIQSCCLWENVFFIIQTHDIIKDHSHLWHMTSFKFLAKSTFVLQRRYFDIRKEIKSSRMKCRKLNFHWYTWFIYKLQCGKKKKNIKAYSFFQPPISFSSSGWHLPSNSKLVVKNLQLQTTANIDFCHTKVSQNFPSILFWTAFTAATLAAVAALFAAIAALLTWSSTRLRFIAFSAVFLAACSLKYTHISIRKSPIFVKGQNQQAKQTIANNKYLNRSKDNIS